MLRKMLPQLESLEVRRLFVTGTAGNDVIEIQMVGDDPLTYRVVVNGGTVEQQTVPSTERVTVDGLGGDDLISADPALGLRVRVNAGEGNDTVVGGALGDILLGQEGDDLIFGKLGSDVLVGGGNDDTLRGGFSADILRGDEDVTFLDFTTDYGDDVLLGEEGEDLIYDSGANDTLNGGLDKDTIQGSGEGDDYVFGGEGDDSIRHSLGSGNPTLDGGNGIDELLVDAFSDATYVTLDGVANDGLRGGGANVLPNFELFRSHGLAPGSVIDFSRATGGVTMRFENGIVADRPLWVTLIGSPFADRFETISRVVRVQLDGRSGDDTIVGGENGDTLVGGGGRDRIAAGAGNDVVYGDHDDGTPDYGSDTIHGSAGNDVLIGGGNNDVILGESGHDTLIGGGSNDRMFGGAGWDRVFGGPGNDSAEDSDEDLFDSVEVTL